MSVAPAASVPRDVALNTIALLLPFLIAAAWWLAPAMGRLAEPVSGGTTFPHSTLSLNPEAPVPAGEACPWTTHTQIVDRQGDGLLDVLVCDARFHRILSCDRRADGGWDVSEISRDLAVPAHTAVVDLDQDGQLDIVVAALGSIWPDDSRIGQVLWLRRTGETYERRTLLEGIRRVADVQPGDFDSDGDIDLAVAVFGYARGEVLWLENDGDENFTEHTLFRAPGAVHVPVGDFDGDGDLDISTVLSQDREEVWGFENLGQGRFTPRRLFRSVNYDLGSAGLVKTDLDQDGDLDFLLPVGDNLEDIHSYPQPYHGCYFLENRGDWTFESRRISSLGGTYAAAAGDLDGDRDLDVVLVSMFNDWDRPGHARLVRLENDGSQQFTPWQIEDPGSPPSTHLVTVDCRDLNGDGRADIATGPLHVMAPFENSPPLTLWLSGGRKEMPR